jgi:hypothetical protein
MVMTTLAASKVKATDNDGALNQKMFDLCHRGGSDDRAIKNLLGKKGIDMHWVTSPHPLSHAIYFCLFVHLAFLKLFSFLSSFVSFVLYISRCPRNGMSLLLQLHAPETKLPRWTCSRRCALQDRTLTLLTSVGKHLFIGP